MFEVRSFDFDDYFAATVTLIENVESLGVLNMAVLAPMPSPWVIMARRVKPGLRKSERPAKPKLDNNIRQLVISGLIR